jgi:hypothetical protein
MDNPSFDPPYFRRDCFVAVLLAMTTMGNGDVEGHCERSEAISSAKQRTRSAALTCKTQAGAAA